MTDFTEQNFVDFIAELIKSKDCVYYSDTNIFYFYHENTSISLESNSISTFVIISQESQNSKDVISKTIEVSIENMKQLITLSLTKTSGVFDFTNIATNPIILKQLNSFENHLDILLKKITNNDLSDRKSFEGVFNNIPFKVCLDHIIPSNNTNKIFNITSLAKIPIYFTGKDKNYYYNVTIPAWKLDQYPIFKNNIQMNNIQSLNETLNDIFTQFSFGKQIHTQLLESAFNKTDVHNVKKNKI